MAVGFGGSDRTHPTVKRSEIAPVPTYSQNQPTRAIALFIHA
ncbi:MAG TPA: hypothetical protein V6D14_15250 [Coleofasciculaceae cyanobacterium]